MEEYKEVKFSENPFDRYEADVMKIELFIGFLYLTNQRKSPKKHR